MKKILSAVLSILTVLAVGVAFSACSNSNGAKSCEITIAIPSDTANRARALLMLGENGYITLKEDAGLTSDVDDIAENPHNIRFVELEAPDIASAMKDYDYAVINSNFAITAGLDPVKDSLVTEGNSSAYGNVLAVKKDKEKSPKTVALAAALESKQVADFINEEYSGAVVSVVGEYTDGYSSEIDYTELAGKKITVASLSAPHAEILAVAKEILAAKDIDLVIKEYDDYVSPNKDVESGKADANYFQHLPYLEGYNAKNGTDLVSVATIHVEPIGLYGGRQSNLDALKG